MSARATLFTALSLALVPTLGSATCPTNYAQGVGRREPDLLQSTSPTWNVSVPCGDIAIDLIAGTVQLSGGGAGGEYTCSAYVEANDTYQIIGPNRDAPLAFDVRVHLSGEVGGGLQSWPYIGTICSSISFRFGLTSGASAAEFADRTTISPCSGHAFESDLVLHLTKLPGEPFPVRYRPELSAHGAHGFIRGVILFEGLPDGYSIRSCQGYGGQPVPATSRSWGELKHTYR